MAQLTPDTLRPSNLAKFIGQTKLKTVLDITIAGAKARQEPIGHTLFVGPPGLGKTTLANILATATERRLIIASGPSVQRLPSLVTILNQLADNDACLFIDEIHRLPRMVEESLYSVMEDFRLDITTGKMHFNLKLPRFTLIGATTRFGMMTKPLRDRFLHQYHLDFYTQDELVQVVQQSATKLHITIDDAAANELARRAKQTPRIANNLLLQSRDFAQSFGIESMVNHAVVLGMMAALDIDECGLSRVDRLLLNTLADKFNGGPAGLNTLASILIEEPDVLEEVYEPYLLQSCFIERTPQGRRLTQQGWNHIGKQPALRGQKFSIEDVWTEKESV